MRNLFLTILLIGITTAVKAQQVEVSAPLKLEKSIEAFKVLGKNKEGIIVRFLGKDDILQAFSPDDLKLKRTKTISFPNQAGDIQYYWINSSGASVFYLTETKKTAILYAQLLDENYNNAGDPIAIDSFDNTSGLVKSNLRSRSSSNQQFTIFYFPVFDGSNIKSMQLVCVNKQLEVQYKVFLPINETNKEMDIAKALVDNDGNAFFVYAADKNTNKSDTTDEFIAYKIMRENPEPSQFVFTTKYEIFGEPFFEIDDKNKRVSFAAFYSADRKAVERGANGFFCQQYAIAADSMVYEGYHPFSDAFMRELTSRVSQLNGNTLFTFSIKKLLNRVDGGLMVVAESIIKDKREEVSGGGISFMNTPMPVTTTVINIYQLNDIISFSTNTKNEVEWYNIIRKKQYSENDGAANSSFFIHNENNLLRYIFMEPVGWDGDIDVATIHSNGKAMKSVLFDQVGKDVYLYVKSGKQIDKYTSVFPSVKGDFFRLVKVNF